MKKFILIITLILTLFSFSYDVKADVLDVDLSLVKFVPFNDVSGLGCYEDVYYYNDFEAFISDSRNKEIFDTLYDDLKNYYDENFKEEYPYYTLSVSLASNSSSKFDLNTVSLVMKLESFEDDPHYKYISADYYDGTYSVFDSTAPVCHSYHITTHSFIPFTRAVRSSFYVYTPLSLFETNYDHYFSDRWGDDVTINLYKDNILDSTYVKGDLLPVYFENGYDSVVESKYTTVNLDDYYYVLLNLKDYSKKEAFNTNLQVKGMIGITPIYNYGTVSKDEIIGNKVEDRCNLSYDDFTSYRLSILKSDLLNNSIYAVKSCKDNSSFKFDNTIFDITYVTDENKDDPIVTIDGKEYHTIPYDNLPSSATKNEEENYVPGESQNFGDIAGNVISKPLDFFKSIASAITSFFGIITSFLSFLPIELRSFLYFSFVIAIVLGILKILL